MLQQIKSRFDGRVLYECEADSMLFALQAAVKSGADLRYADLGYADLGYADLGYANLMSADLRYANLRYANLEGKPILNIIQLSGIGSERRSTVAIVLADEIRIQCGCFTGSLPEFSAKIEKTHENHPRWLAEYRAAVAWIEAGAVAVRTMEIKTA